MLFHVLLSLYNIFALNNEENDQLVSSSYKALYWRQQDDGRWQIRVEVSLRIDLMWDRQPFGSSKGTMAGCFVEILICIFFPLCYFSFIKMEDAVRCSSFEFHGQSQKLLKDNHSYWDAFECLRASGNGQDQKNGGNKGLGRFSNWSLKKQKRSNNSIIFAKDIPQD